jgi:DNA (cytosine-5)-methyltransferase 1
VSIGSLFSGIGGLELGLERAGLGPVLWQCEIDPYCRAVLARHWPAATRYEDVRELSGAALPRVDVVCGGFPCQDVSDAGRRAGLAGARSGLWYEYARIVEEARPRVVVVENVRGLLGRGLDVVAGRLDDLGYDVEVTRIRAADVGAPHLRERVFLVAVADADRSGRRDDGRGQEAGRASGRVADAGREVAHPEREGQPQPQGALADVGGRAGDGGRLECAAEPRVGGGAHGLPAGLDGPGPGGAWPAGRGEAQHPWEPPRTLAGVKARPARLRALGNAVVPQVAYVVGCRVAERLRERP